MSATSVVRWCFHTTALVADYELTRDALIEIAGLRVLEDSRLEDPLIGRRGGMAWLGDNIIEIGEPIVAGGAVDRFVRRFGSHVSSIAVQVADIDATVEHLARHQVRVASRVDRIVFSHPADTGGIAIEWFGDEEARDPRFGGSLPPSQRRPHLQVEQMAFGGAVVDDPLSTADRLAALFDREMTFRDEHAAAGHPVAGVSLGDMTLALYAMPAAAASRQLWGHVYSRPQTCNIGLRVADLAASAEALRAAAVPIVRFDPHSIVVDPYATGGVILVVVEELLPGDPRSAAGGGVG